MDNDEFKAQITEYCSLTDELGAAQKALRGLKKRKTELGQAILSFMGSNSIDVCELPAGGGKLERRENKRLETLKKDHVSAELVSRALPQAQCEQILSSIDAAREVVVKASLKRIKSSSS